MLTELDSVKTTGLSGAIFRIDNIIHLLMDKKDVSEGMNSSSLFTILIIVLPQSRIFCEDEYHYILINKNTFIHSKDISDTLSHMPDATIRKGFLYNPSYEVAKEIDFNQFNRGQ